MQAVSLCSDPTFGVEARLARLEQSLLSEREAARLELEGLIGQLQTARAALRARSAYCDELEQELRQAELERDSALQELSKLRSEREPPPPGPCQGEGESEAVEDPGRPPVPDSPPSCEELTEFGRKLRAATSVRRLPSFFRHTPADSNVSAVMDWLERSERLSDLIRRAARRKMSPSFLVEVLFGLSRRGLIDLGS
ncbi:MAG: hypothetical protein HYZ28_15730 [Myxococcales bacterium]|nr:hypothetical protein [Myxococcales bacterium]